ncbi:MAG: LuxR C-terminal-related transcriptional regulator [Planctomycetota bacterium]
MTTVVRRRIEERLRAVLTEAGEDLPGECRFLGLVGDPGAMREEIENLAQDHALGVVDLEATDPRLGSAAGLAVFLDLDVAPLEEVRRLAPSAPLLIAAPEQIRGLPRAIVTTRPVAYLGADEAPGGRRSTWLRLVRAAEDFVSRDAFCRSFQERFASLSDGEIQVLGGLLDGRLNKHIAADLGLSERTIEDRRARILKKMDAPHLAVLIERVVLHFAPGAS